MRARSLTAFALCCFVFCIAFASTPAAEPVSARVLLDSGDRLVLDFRFGDYESSVVDIAGQPHTELKFPSEPVVMDPGAPALPHVNRSVVIPDDARMSLRVLDADYREVQARIAPSKGSILRTVDPATVPYEFGPAYASDAYYPGPLAELGEPYILRDRRGARLRVYPFQYNPVTGVLRVYSHVRVELTATGPGVVNVLDRAGRPTRASQAYQAIYGSHFLNEETSPLYDPLDEEGEMLIIAHDPWIPDLASFVSHKAQVGITANVVGVSTIGNSASAIKAHIQQVYNSSNLAFVLLVGDIDEVASYMWQGGASDPEYSKLAGNDDYPEIIVGRFSARDLGELTTQLERTIEYESLPATEADWFWKGTGVASAEGAGIGDEGQSDKQHAGEIRDWLLGAGYTEVDEIYDPGAYAGEVTSALNAGRGVVNYTGHGWPQGWSTSGFDNNDVHALVNDNMLPFIVTVACNNGEFESYGECFAEAWMRAEHNGEPTGAIGVYASSISQSWAEPMEGQDEFNLLLTDPSEPYFSFGAMAFAGSCSMMDDYGTWGVDMFNTWILFGDPSLRVRGSAAPHGMQVSPTIPWSIEGQAGGPFNPETMTYTITNLNNYAINYRVEVAGSWIHMDHSFGWLSPGGSVEIPLWIDETVRHWDNGTYIADVQFVNLTDLDDGASRTAALSVGIPTLVYQWNLDTMPFWYAGGRWEFGQPLGQGGDVMGFPDPTSGATGNLVYGVNLDGDFPITLGDFYLVSGPIDLENANGVSVRFRRWLNSEAPPNASVSVGASSNGIDWTDVWTNSEAIGDNAWTTQAQSIAAVADGRAGARVRWGYHVHTDEALPCSGWNIDDIEIWAVPEGTARISLSLGAETLSWTAVQGAVAYDVVYGDLATLGATDGDFTAAAVGCVAGGVAGNETPYVGNPEPGQGHWYLVRGRTAEQPMTWQALYPSQVGLRDDEINAGASCP